LICPETAASQSSIRPPSCFESVPTTSFFRQIKQGKGKPDLKDATPAGGRLTVTEFNIGKRKFTRGGIDQPYGRSENNAAASRALGTAAETDYCRTKKPGPPLGLEPASFGALNQELPQAALKLDGNTRAGRRLR
jgi:hypothetical protein